MTPIEVYQDGYKEFLPLVEVEDLTLSGERTGNNLYNQIVYHDRDSHTFGSVFKLALAAKMVPFKSNPMNSAVVTIAEAKLSGKIADFSRSEIIDNFPNHLLAMQSWFKWGEIFEGARNNQAYPFSLNINTTRYSREDGFKDIPIYEINGVSFGMAIYASPDFDILTHEAVKKWGLSMKLTDYQKMLVPFGLVL